MRKFLLLPLAPAPAIESELRWFVQDHAAVLPPGFAAEVTALLLTYPPGRVLRAVEQAATDVVLAATAPPTPAETETYFGLVFTLERLTRLCRLIARDRAAAQATRAAHAATERVPTFNAPMAYA